MPHSPDRIPGVAGTAQQRPWHRAERATVIGLAVFVAASLVAGALIGKEAMLQRLTTIAPAVLAGMLGLSLINYAARMARWQLFSRRQGLALPVSRNALYYAAGFALTATPGKMGEALRLWLLKRGHGVTLVRSSSLMIADRLSDMTAIVLLALGSAAAYADYMSLTALSALAMLVVLVVLMRPALIVALVGRAYALVGRYGRGFGRVRQSLRQLGALGSLPVFGGGLLLALGGWFAEIIAFWWLLHSMGAEVTLVQATFVFSFGLGVGAVSFLPGGLGGTEATMVGLLVLNDVPADLAVAATVVIRLTTLWFASIIGFIAFPLALKSVEIPGQKAAA